MLIKDFVLLRKILKPIKIYNLYYFKPVRGFSFDTRSIKEGEVFIALRGKYKDGHDFIKEAERKGASLIIAEKDIKDRPKIPYFIVNDSLEAIKRIATFVRKKKNPFVFAITGSLGKTTTKEMLSFLLSKNFRILKNYKTENNILGISKTILSLQDEEILVLELGTNCFGEIKQLAEITFPDVGIITFIKPTHLEGLKNLKGVFEEKISLLKMNPNIKAVLNREDSYLRKIKFCKEIYWFGRKKDCDVYARFIKRESSKTLFLIQNEFKLRLPLQFERFILNALAAILGASLYGLSIKELTERMNKFDNFPRGRMELKKMNGLLIIDDSYNANPYSFKEAFKVLKNFPYKKIAIIGDMLELGEKSKYYHTLIANAVIKSNFRYCLTIGEHTIHIRNKLRELGFRASFHFSSHKEIAHFIRRKAKKGDLIFLKGSRKMELEKILTFL
jgi:UDP-N-acetylmuramoyl-tripeptide--D-alanyl-D-alanine ligase